MPIRPGNSLGNSLGENKIDEIKTNKMFLGCSNSRNMANVLLGHFIINPKSPSLRDELVRTSPNF